MANFLNLRCPRCLRDDAIDIEATVWLRVGAEGTEPEASATEGHFDYRPRSLAVCAHCTYQGRLFTFESHGKGGAS
jgi:hypothetical protein